MTDYEELDEEYGGEESFQPIKRKQNTEGEWEAPKPKRKTKKFNTIAREMKAFRSTHIEESDDDD